MRTQFSHCLTALSFVVLLTGCYDVTLKDYTGGDSGQDASTIWGEETGSDRASGEDVVAVTPDTPGVGTDVSADAATDALHQVVDNQLDASGGGASEIGRVGGTGGGAGGTTVVGGTTVGGGTGGGVTGTGGTLGAGGATGGVSGGTTRTGGATGTGGTGVQKACGGTLFGSCAAGEFCEDPWGVCGASGGVCVVAPSVCSVFSQPVCGCDGKTYNNDCERVRAGAYRKSDGACATPDAGTGGSVGTGGTPADSVTTLAGTAGLSGSTDGTGSAARFNKPIGVAVDGSGNVFVAEYTNWTIREITPSGLVTTFAGTAGRPGSSDGTGAAASFDYPLGVAVDGSGNVLVADGMNSTIREITPGGLVTTLAGTPGMIGSADGTGASARFSAPHGVAADGSGNIFVADWGSTIRKITPGGVVTTFAGSAGSPGSTDGTGSAARFNRPYGVAVDGSGNIFVADTGNNTIRKITPAGVVTTFAGTAGSPGSTDGTGSAARFNSPCGVAVDGSGNVFVADTGSNTIRKVTPTGVVTTLAGSSGVVGNADGTRATARFNGPSSVAVDGSGNVFVADTGNNTIRKITASGG